MQWTGTEVIAFRVIGSWLHGAENAITAVSESESPTGSQQTGATKATKAEHLIVVGAERGWLGGIASSN